MSSEDNIPWNRLENVIGERFNNFCIIRGDRYITWGKDVWVGVFCVVDGSGGLEIGNNVTISSGAHVYTHDSSWYRKANLEKDPIDGTHVKKAPVRIGNNVQIGANSIVLPGVTIGNNVIVGALSLVNRDVPNRCIAYGSPIIIRNELGETW